MAGKVIKKESRIPHWMRPRSVAVKLWEPGLFAGAGTAFKVGSDAGDVDGCIGAESFGAVFIEKDDGELGGFDVEFEAG